MKNQRRGPDFIIQSIGWFSTTSWIILIFIYGALVFLNPALRGVTWNNLPARNISAGWLAILYSMFILLIIINIAGIIFNFVRLKRKTDRIRTTFLISIIAAIIGLIIISVK